MPQTTTFGTASDMTIGPLMKFGNVLMALPSDKAALRWFSKGEPEAQGSIRPLPKAGKRLAGAAFSDVILTSDNKDLKRWRAIVRNDAVCARIKAVGNAGLRDITWPTGPVSLLLVWRLPRPKRLKPAAPLEHLTRPDIDKLERAVLDALTGVLYTDDGQVQTVLKQKFVAGPDQVPGVEVTAWQ
jgi:crossover junction endodeoxyribonuclease RusA